jgi:hypothetical protein
LSLIGASGQNKLSTVAVTPQQGSQNDTGAAYTEQLAQHRSINLGPLRLVEFDSAIRRCRLREAAWLNAPRHHVSICATDEVTGKARVFPWRARYASGY